MCYRDIIMQVEVRNKSAVITRCFGCVSKFQSADPVCHCEHHTPLPYIAMFFFKPVLKDLKELCAETNRFR